MRRCQHCGLGAARQTPRRLLMADIVIVNPRFDLSFYWVTGST
jgi:hypothetical protein